MEENLQKWIMDTIKIGKKPITANMVKEKALFYSNCPDFNASKGWLVKFRKKFDFEIVTEKELKRINKEKEDAKKKIKKLKK
jgi:hypothetical protein